MFEVENITFENAHNFLDALRIKNWTSEHAWESDWCFRGHGDATWELRPSAWRWSKEPLQSNEAQRIIISSIGRNSDMIDRLIKNWFDVKGIPARENDYSLILAYWFIRLILNMI